MKYALLLFGTEESWEAMDEEMIKEYVALDDAIKEKGIIETGAGLHQPSTATTVRVRDGKRTVTDGPYAETKEHIGGIYLVECESLDDAIECAAKVPDARLGCVEIRPVLTPEDMGLD